MRRRLATLAVVSALALALSASPALAGSPAEHFRSMPVGTMTFDCGSTSLHTTSGTMNYVTRSADTPSGNWSLTGTITLSRVTAVVGKPYYPQWRSYPGFGGAGARRSVENGVAITRVPHYVPAKPGAWPACSISPALRLSPCPTHSARRFAGARKWCW